MRARPDGLARSAEGQNRHGWVLLSVVCSAQLILAVDVTIVNVANASIERALGFTTDNLQWTVSAYALAFGGFLLVGGRIADMWSRRRLFICGVLAFAVASVAAGSSQTMPELIVSRLAQGLCAAVISPTTLAFITSSFPQGRKRHGAYAAWATAGSLGGLLGLLVGGVVTATLGWRWIFFINAPIALVVVSFAYFLLLADEKPIRRRSLDLSGAVTITVALSLFIFGLGEVESSGWGSLVVIMTLTVPVPLFVVFWGLQRNAPDPLVPKSLIKRRAAVGNVLAALQQAMGTATLFLCPLFMQQVLGYSVDKAGAGTLPLPIFFAVGSRLSSRVMNSFGARKLVLLGFTLMAIGLAWLARTPTNASYMTSFLPGLCLRGLGQGLCVVPTLSTVTADVQPSQHGTAAGLYNMSQQVGAALGVAAVAAVASSTQLGFRSRVAIAHGMHDGFAFGVVMAVIGALITFALLPGRTASVLETPPMPVPQTD
jgi:EmrB/QacA subfamily drug resistance transporter